MRYQKPSLPITEQIDRLKRRGLVFNNEDKAAHYLSNISYYRLRAYTYPFQDNKNPEHSFIKKVNFEDIIALYVFDRRLRLLVFNAIEKIEIALRTKIIYEYSLVHGSHWFLKKELFHKASFYDSNYKSLKKEVERSTETFIKHYFKNYTAPELPPAWMSLEVISLGLLGKIFSNLKRGKVKTKVANEFGLKNDAHLESWIHSFAYLRNICAHHGRLWNRRFIVRPVIPYNTLNAFLDNTRIHDNKLYAQLSCINYILQSISPKSSFVGNLKTLLNESTIASEKEMGFPENWKEETLWN